MSENEGNSKGVQQLDGSQEQLPKAKASRAKKLFFLAIIIATALYNGFLFLLLVRAAEPVTILGYRYNQIAEEVVGLPIEKVEAKYGPSTSYGRSLFPRWDRVYQLGREASLFGIDYAWLLVRLDENSRVVEAKIGTD